MDTVSLHPHEMEHALRFLKLTNHHFGGINVILKHLRQWSKNWRPGETILILDIGTGGAEIPTAIAKWGKTKGFDLRITGIDLVSTVTSIARANTSAYPEIDIRQMDMFALAQTGETFDYVTASLLLHHIRPAEEIAALHAFDRLAKRGIVISDLLRSHASYWVVSALSYLCGNQVVRHDGPLSVRRAYQPKELEQMAKNAGLSYLRAQKEPWFRVSLAGEK